MLLHECEPHCSKRDLVFLETRDPCRRGFCYHAMYHTEALSSVIHTNFTLSSLFLLTAWCFAWWRRRRSTWTSWRRSSRASCAPSRWPPPPRTRPATTRTSTASFWQDEASSSFLPFVIVPPFEEFGKRVGSRFAQIPHRPSCANPAHFPGNCDLVCKLECTYFW